MPVRVCEMYLNGPKALFSVLVNKSVLTHSLFSCDTANNCLTYVKKCSYL